ncbi:MAG: RagB/SusD family nutrient uptake outer membrane protein [Bacteroidota bacterium]
MKKTSIYMILILLVLFSTGCKKDFLERTEPAVISLESFYADADDAEMAIIACYGPLQWPYFVSPLMLPDMMSDDGVKGSTYGDNSLHWNEMAEFQGLTSAGIIEWKWRTTFRVIFRTNMVLSRVPEIEMDEVRRNQILGEAYFLRGYAFFECAIAWGNVPIITEPLEDYYIPNNPSEEVWAQVISDLEQAIELLPEKSEWPANQIGRATKGAAIALLGKTHLYRHEFQEAEDIFRPLVESGEYTLASDFGEVFTLEGENGTGSILELQFAELGEDDVYAAEGNFIIKFQGPRDITGWGFNQGTFKLLNEFGYYAVDNESLDKLANYGPTPDANLIDVANSLSALSGNQYESHEALKTALAGAITAGQLANYEYIICRSLFKPADPRFEHTFVFLDETVDGVYINPDIGQATDHYTGVYNKKAFMAHVPDIWRLAPINERLIRLSDIYLMYAEAAAENGNTGEAITYLNMVRQRAASGSALPLNNFPNYTDGYGVQYEDTGEDLLRAIYNERRLELAFEHHRFWDLVRTGQAADVLGEFGYVEGVHNVFPIPQGDIDRSGGVLVQNPGY